ncbi:MAG: hemolysin family protein [Bacteroidales bacterium]|nr:hemolysin family protein [Bacteroidales bacterium]MCD8393650.1 hemolysin family protein [Bacteroidales bacterium]
MDFDPLPANAGFCCILGFIDTFGAAQIVALCLAVIALFISGFISGSETAFFSLNTSDLEEIDDTPRGEAVIKLLKQPERLLATILIANNLVNVTIVVLCSFALTPLFEGMSPVANFILQTVILTFLILLFGEIIPKLYSNSNSLKWALGAYPGLNFAVKLFSPLASMLVKSSGFVNRVVTRKAQNISTDELSQALEITQVQGAEQKEMLEGILKFGDTTAAEIMTPRVDITDLDIDMTFDEVMETVISTGYARLPVVEDTQDNIRGILYSRDLLPYIEKREPDFRWQTLMREPYYVPESRMIDDLLEDFRKLKIHIAVVVDEFGGTQGVVTLEDVLEEIVGDINDEYDEDEQTYKRLPDNTYIFEGKTLLNDFFKVTGLDEEEYQPVAEDCETLAGMLLNIKGDFPKEKEPLVYGHCRFLILDIDHHRIASVRVKVMNEIQNQ